MRERRQEWGKYREEKGGEDKNTFEQMVYKQ